MYNKYNLFIYCTIKKNKKRLIHSIFEIFAIEIHILVLYLHCKIPIVIDAKKKLMRNCINYFYYPSLFNSQYIYLYSNANLQFRLVMCECVCC